MNSTIEKLASGTTGTLTAKVLVEQYRCVPHHATFTVPQAYSQWLIKLCRHIPHDESSICGNPSELIDDLRYERYVKYTSWQHSPLNSRLGKSVYYQLRPLIPFRLRSRLKQLQARGWQDATFPAWPVDHSVETILERLLMFSLKSHALSNIPFIWFWPDGYESCAIMTHDVETEEGKEFCQHLMDINDRYGVKSSFQLIPEERYIVSKQFLDSIRNRGFEINIHDLNHDGYLFKGHKQFLQRAARINQYAANYGAVGFRAGVMYRNPDWFEALNISYDMSFPSVARLDPQRGGCCTVMPYFIGSILELPLTTIQDYYLFHVFNDYSLALWKAQSQRIMNRHGLISFIVHPDYIIERRARNTYEVLLTYLAELRRERNVWLALPGEVNSWWRQRQQMQLIRHAGTWQIGGHGSERARVAYATAAGDSIQYTFEQPM